MIPSRRFAGGHYDQGAAMFAEAMAEWEKQPVAAPPRPAPAVVQEVAKPAPVVIDEMQDIVKAAGENS